MGSNPTSSAKIRNSNFRQKYGHKNSSNKIISENKSTWDIVADLFVNSSALPVWGPFGIGDDLNLIPEIKGKTFLEIGCGSGRSIKYLTENGAKKVYGLDLSPKQIEEATAHNQEEIKQNKVQLIRGSMEEKIKIKPVDFVFSIYAIGWTPEPEKHLKIFTHISNQAGYLFGVGTIPSLLMFSMKTENLSSFTNTMRKIHSYSKIGRKRCYRKYNLSENFYLVSTIAGCWF